MTETAGALGELTQAVLEFDRGQGRLNTAMSDVACEQRITNFIVRPPITTDPVEKDRPTSEASPAHGPPRRRSPQESV
ncbi:hypothetical protein OG705_29290 [Streptomyces sp. NBC_00838]|uniref:hypothetical protein n=1 Tax=Streptomyces sp. NBC_00838 TaxID=2903680 RepID=UPI0038688C85|nr:hypothetical protein OG705_29290 [Streptomyces sp. NBC_00838]